MKDIKKGSTENFEKMKSMTYRIAKLMSSADNSSTIIIISIVNLHEMSTMLELC